MQFVDAEEVTTVSKTDLETFRDRPVRLGENTHINGLTLTNDENEECLVITCREFEKALSQGFYAKTTFDMKMATWFEHQCGLLSALETADAPAQSFLITHDPQPASRADMASEGLPRLHTPIQPACS